MEWITLDAIAPNDSQPSMVAPDKRSGWTWGADGSPDERRQREQEQISRETLRRETAKEMGAIAGTAAADAVNAQINKFKNTAQYQVRSGWEAQKQNINLTLLVFGVIALHGSVSWMRPILNTAASLYNFNPLQRMVDGLPWNAQDVSYRGGNPHGPYEVATPYLYDQSPPGSWDFTLIDPDTRSQYVPVPSPCDGVISQSGWISGYGNSVAVDCRSGDNWFMAHNESLSVSVGDRVREGEQISIQGSTGNSTGPHIHLEIDPATGSKTDRASTKPLLDNYFVLLKSGPSNVQFASHLPPSDPNIRAFLDTLGWAEGADYNTLVGGGTFHHFGSHPDIYHAPSNSDAAGKYQFLKDTWDQYAKSEGLNDFSPSSQDKAAIAILKENRVPELLAQGKINEAFCSVGDVWASLPCNNYGQPQKTYKQLLGKYESFGGSVHHPQQRTISPRTNDLLNRNTRRI